MLSFLQATPFKNKIAVLYINFLAQGQFGDGFAKPADRTSLDSKGSAVNALSNLEQFISRMIALLTIIASVFFIFYFILGAFNWVTAGGDSSKIQKARDQMIQGVLGMIVIVVSYALIGIIGTVIGVDILNLQVTLDSIF